jgi:adenylosuccinate synthase
VDGEVTDVFPVPAKLGRAKPVFEYLPGWKCDIRGITDYEALPQAAKNYVDFLEEKIGYPITLVSTGPARTEITHRATKL